MLYDLEDRLDHRLAVLEGEDDVVRYKGQLFTMTGMDEKGNRYLVNQGNTVGQVNPDLSIELWGQGEEESERKTGKKYIPKVTGWELTWDDAATGKRTGRFYPAGFPQANLDKLVRLYAQKGLGPVLKQARGKSKYSTVGIPPGTEVVQKKMKKEGGLPPGELKLTQDQLTKLAEMLGVSTQELLTAGGKQITIVDEPVAPAQVPAASNI